QPQSRKQLGTSSGRVPQPGRLLRISSARSTSHGDCRETEPAASRRLFSPFAGGCFLFVPIWIWGLPPFFLMFFVSVICLRSAAMSRTGEQLSVHELCCSYHCSEFELSRNDPAPF